MSNTPTFLNGEQNYTTVHTDITFLWVRNYLYYRLLSILLQPH